jgi:NAD(P)-dependent dehydrogenase (short-subunit alcohol dehydrogenase family)
VATVVVVGASRGIGRELVRQYAAAGDDVIATYRRAEHAAHLAALGAAPLRLDVVDDDVADVLAGTLASRPIDVAIISAGLYGPRTTTLAAPSRLDFDAVMHTNVYGPMQVIPVLTPGLAAARGKLALITSRMGSISLMAGTSGWLYRASKAAANALAKSASNELRNAGVTCIALHPGWVRTDMGGTGADIDLAPSVAGMRRVLAGLSTDDNGRFFNYDGTELSW